MNRPVIISLGEVLWDLFPEGPRFGGAPANFACHAAVLGGDVAMVSAVGDDSRAVGQFLLEKMTVDAPTLLLEKPLRSGNFSFDGGRYNRQDHQLAVSMLDRRTRQRSAIFKNDPEFRAIVGGPMR